MSKRLTYRQLVDQKGWPYTRQHTDRLVKAGKFPRPIKAVEGGSKNLWDEAEYDALMAARVAARDTLTEDKITTSRLKT